jgi:WD40 repeat protein
MLIFFQIATFTQISFKKDCHLFGANSANLLTMEHDLAELIDRLPQPYRCINNIINKILLHVDNAVEKIETERVELQSKGKLRKITPRCQSSYYFSKEEVTVGTEELRKLVQVEPEKELTPTFSGKNLKKQPPPKTTPKTPKVEDEKLAPVVLGILPENIDDFCFSESGDRAFVISSTGTLSVADTTGYVAESSNEGMETAQIITFKKVLTTPVEYSSSKEEQEVKKAPSLSTKQASRSPSPMSKTPATPSKQPPKTLPKMDEPAPPPKEPPITLHYRVRAKMLLGGSPTKVSNAYLIAVACLQRPQIQLYSFYELPKKPVSEENSEETKPKETLRLVAEINMLKDLTKYSTSATNVPAFLMNEIQLRDDLRYLSVGMAPCSVSASALLYRLPEWNVDELVEQTKQYDTECAFVVEPVDSKFGGHPHNSNVCRLLFITNSELVREISEINQMFHITKLNETHQKKLAVHEVMIWWAGVNVLAKYKLPENIVNEKSYVRKDWTFSDGISALAIEPSNNQLYCTGLMNGSITLWQTRTGTALCFLESHPSKVDFIYFHKDKYLLTADNNRTVHCYDLTKSKEKTPTYPLLYKLRYYESEPNVDSLLVAQNMPVLFIVTDRFIDIYDIASGTALCALREYRFASESVKSKLKLMGDKTVVLVDNKMTNFDVYRFMDLLLCAYPHIKEIIQPEQENKKKDVTQELLNFITAVPHEERLTVDSAKRFVSHTAPLFRLQSRDQIKTTQPQGTVLTLSSLRDKKLDAQRSTNENTQSLRVMRTKQFIEDTRTERKQRLVNSLPKSTPVAGTSKK